MDIKIIIKRPQSLKWLLKDLVGIVPRNILLALKTNSYRVVHYSPKTTRATDWTVKSWLFLASTMIGWFTLAVQTPQIKEFQRGFKATTGNRFARNFRSFLNFTSWIHMLNFKEISHTTRSAFLVVTESGVRRTQHENRSSWIRFAFGSLGPPGPARNSQVRLCQPTEKYTDNSIFFQTFPNGCYRNKCKSTMNMMQ